MVFPVQESRLSRVRDGDGGRKSDEGSLVVQVRRGGAC